MADRYAGLVKGPAAIFPRGYLLLIPLWYAAAAAALVLKGGLPRWYTVIALGALLLATVIVTGSLATLRQNAFAADNSGVWLGNLPRRRWSRRQRLLVPWSQIEQLRISDRRYGARLDVVLGPAASIIHRHRLVSGIFFAGLAVIVPPPWIGRPAGLLALRHRTHRYQIPICDVTADQLGVTLAALAPPTVGVGVVLRRRG
jgi:hypothetical protein